MRANHQLLGPVARVAAQNGATQRILQKMEHGLSNVNIVVLGDSTGNDQTEWIYLMGVRLGALYPAYSVQYRLWNDASASYDAPVTVQTGTGAYTLHIWNASVGGKHIYYPDLHGFTAQVVAPDPNIVIISHGHNENLTSTAEAWQLRARFIMMGQYITARVPGAAVILVAQNPWTDSTIAAQKTHIISEVASLCGFGFINVHDRFETQSDWKTALMADSIHPNAAGHLVWVDEVMRHFVFTPDFRPPAQPPSTFTAAVPNLLVNGDFSAFTGALPDNWSQFSSPNAMTASKDLTNFETGAHGVKLVTGADSNGYLYQDVHIANAKTPLNFYKGKWVTLAVRFRKPIGQGANVGRLALNDGVTTATSRGNYDGIGEWYWDVCTLKVADSPTRIRAYLYANTSAGASVEVTIDRAILCTGLFPHDMF